MNTAAIDKIIKDMSYRDYKASWNRLTEAKKRYYRLHPGMFSYSLGSDTKEAIETKRNYVSGNITEEEYKAFCLKYNLLNATNNNK